MGKRNGKNKQFLIRYCGGGDFETFGNPCPPGRGSIGPNLCHVWIMPAATTEFGNGTGGGRDTIISVCCVNGGVE